MSSLITSADATFVITVKTLFNAPITLENWSASKAWEVQANNIAAYRMSIDGKLNRGYKPTPIDMTLHLQPNSDSWDVFNAIYTASKQAMTSYTIGGEMHLPALGRKYTFNNGFIENAQIVPGAGELIDEQSVHLVWESILPAGI